MEQCLYCKQTENLIPCRQTNKEGFNAHILDILQEQSKEYCCTKCIKDWTKNAYEYHKNLLKQCTRFDEDHVKDRYIFRHQGMEEKSLVFLPNELNKEHKALVRKLKVLTEKIRYVYGKGYQIPFYKQYTLSRMRKARPCTHTDKYGNTRTITL